MKLQPRKCGTCRYCDRDSYRGAKKIVCYQLNKSPEGKPIAWEVRETKKACNGYVEAK